ncbi:Os01g0694500 [Oryza sativa Japonica Group]|uniref:Os01g0694500 protein n=1 Tax=Oryza sativa subsp. japonica TaxID=39947 RepID=A0A0P0V6X1_ORYSJ|nr:Os01g0694500 [Oryza sativa Japonica Group]
MLPSAIGHPMPGMPIQPSTRLLFVIADQCVVSRAINYLFFVGLRIRPVCFHALTERQESFSFICSAVQSTIDLNVSISSSGLL